MGAAADDLTDNEGGSLEKRRREEEDKRKPKLSFDRGTARYEIDRSSSISAKASLGMENGKPKLRGFGVEYRKEF